MDDSNIVTKVLSKAKYIGDKAESPLFWESATTGFFIPIILILIGMIIYLIMEKFDDKDEQL